MLLYDSTDALALLATMSTPSSAASEAGSKDSKRKSESLAPEFHEFHEFHEFPSLFIQRHPTSSNGRATTDSHLVVSMVKDTRTASTLTPAQLARKRANDRESQRAIRARTKEHIANLEKEVHELRSRDNPRAVQELLRCNEALEYELAQLREAFTIGQPKASAINLQGSLYTEPRTIPGYQPTSLATASAYGGGGFASRSSDNSSYLWSLPEQNGTVGSVPPIPHRASHPEHHHQQPTSAYMTLPHRSHSWTQGQSADMGAQVSSESSIGKPLVGVPAIQSFAGISSQDSVFQSSSAPAGLGTSEAMESSLSLSWAAQPVALGGGDERLSQDNLGSRLLTSRYPASRVGSPYSQNPRRHLGVGSIQPCYDDPSPPGSLNANSAGPSPDRHVQNWGA